ncbi:UNVERIFIED_CONTAM: hypothetical protein FKN15_046318 [Acipenser sinensis]
MAQIKPFYTVKCNTSTALIEILAALGIGFACASKNEIALVQSYGVDPENILYTSMCKQLSQIKYAAKNGIDILVCDNEPELMKIARNHPSAKFHISSSCKDLQAYTHAVSDARCVFDMGAEFGFNMSILDIGGGFSGAEFLLEEIYSAVSPLLDIYFPPESGVSVIAEPGSYYVASSFTLAVNIIAKKVVARDQNKELEPSPNDEPAYMYYMNDGIYGSFASKLTDNTIAVPSVHKKYNKEEALFASSLWGPSSDALDQVVEHCLLPELNAGDWVIFDNMGANTLGEQSAFNDFQKPPVYYLISAYDWYEMQDAGITLDTTMKNFLFVPSCFHTSQEDRISAPA